MWFFVTYDVEFCAAVAQRPVSGTPEVRPKPGPERGIGKSRKDWSRHRPIGAVGLDSTRGRGGDRARLYCISHDECLNAVHALSRARPHAGDRLPVATLERLRAGGCEDQREIGEAYERCH